MGARDRARERFPQAHCAYETLPTGPELVVPREMATTHCDSDLHPMPFNHLGMTKTRGRDTDPYLWTMTRVIEASREVAERESLWTEV